MARRWCCCCCGALAYVGATTGWFETRAGSRVGQVERATLRWRFSSCRGEPAARAVVLTGCLPRWLPSNCLWPTHLWNLGDLTLAYRPPIRPSPTHPAKRWTLLPPQPSRPHTPSTPPLTLSSPLHLSRSLSLFRPIEPDSWGSGKKRSIIRASP